MKTGRNENNHRSRPAADPRNVNEQPDRPATLCLPAVWIDVKGQSWEVAPPPVVVVVVVGIPI